MYLKAETEENVSVYKKFRFDLFNTIITSFAFYLFKKTTKFKF